jgi:hypothetical protein
MITASDLQQFEKKGISPETIEKQIAHFREGFPFALLTTPATPGNGIMVLDDAGVSRYERLFNGKAMDYDITKMVPASGAASRMFKDLHAYLDDGQAEAGKAVMQFIENIRAFAFFPALKSVLAGDGYDIDSLIADGDYRRVIAGLLEDEGLGYANLPKGLLDFHTYPDGPRTPIEEHMAESIEYSRDSRGTAHLHFTVSPEHLDRFREKAQTASERIGSATGTRFNITYSVQKPSTDTIAVGMDNTPFRDGDGRIVFRPGGHGALIENLNDLDADIVFIKNIDNVVPDRLKQPTYIYKKVLGGLLIELKEWSSAYLKELEDGTANEDRLMEITDLMTNHMNIRFPGGFSHMEPEEKTAYLKSMLDRPIRVCGMVKNEGEPGGGPFWVTGSDGNTGLQIVESSQIDMDNPQQVEILKASTHFNPVDLVCSIKDHYGRKYDLHRFIDPQTGFISIKSKDGRELKAQELPGLWNGAMAHWITVFVEVPIETFNPVKTVNDLLRPQHQ